MSKSSEDIIHEVQMALTTASLKLHDVQLRDNPEGLNAKMYEALVMAEKEMEHVFKLTGHSCAETWSRMRDAISDYDRVQRSTYGEI